MPTPRDGSLRPSRLTADTKYQLLLQIAQRLSGTLDLDEILNHLLDRSPQLKTQGSLLRARNPGSRTV